MFSQELTCEHLELMKKKITIFQTLTLLFNVGKQLLCDRVFNSFVKSERYELSQKKKRNSCMTNAEDTNIKKKLNCFS